jgi:hypothetical protein
MGLHRPELFATALFVLSLAQERGKGTLLLVVMLGGNVAKICICLRRERRKTSPSPLISCILRVAASSFEYVP